MTQGWIEKVADTAKISVGEAARMLSHRGIRPDRSLRPARSLVVNRIAFAGEKRGTATGRIAFDWSGLSSGVWAVTSHANLVGKSSVLEVLLWCFRGEPKSLQEDVRSWLKSVLVGFEVDDQRYLVEFDVVEKVPNGTLSRLRPDGAVDVLDRFTSDAGFAAAMSRFMMDTLDLDPVPARQGNEEDKQTVVHGWTALSGALYFGGDHKLLLGDVQWGGLPARMLQMYVGLPWASTVMQASTAKKEVEQELARATRATSETAARTVQARSRIEVELEAARETLATAMAEQATAAELDQLAGEIGRLSAVVLEMEQRVSAAEDEYKLLKQTADDDERSVRNLRENLVATSFFNGLQPTCCPRCDAAVTKDRVTRESAQFSCSLCSEPIAEEQLDGASDAIEEAERRHSISQVTVERSKAGLPPLRAQLKLTRASLQTTRDALVKAAQSDAFAKRRGAELEVARLEGALKERQSEPTGFLPPADAALVDAALAEANAAFEAQRGDLLERLNDEILRLGKSFGVLRLEKVKLNWVAQMRLEKGGQPTSFSKLTAGERLRLRIATAIALIRVGRERGVGRHPGLLVIDSPGAEETSDSDLATLLGELKKIAGETPGLQILVASADAPAVLSALGENKCRVAAAGTYLW